MLIACTTLIFCNFYACGTDSDNNHLVLHQLDLSPVHHTHCVHHLLCATCPKCPTCPPPATTFPQSPSSAQNVQPTLYNLPKTSNLSNAHSAPDQKPAFEANCSDWACFWNDSKLDSHTEDDSSTVTVRWTTMCTIVICVCVFYTLCRIWNKNQVTCMSRVHQNMGVKFTL